MASREGNPIFGRTTANGEINKKITGNASVSFANGISNYVKKDHPLSKIGVLDKSKYILWHDDFNNYVSGHWEKTVVEAGSGSHAVGVATAGSGGLLELTTDNANNDRVLLQYKGNAAQAVGSFVMDPKKKTYMAMRFKVDNWQTCAFHVGMMRRLTSFSGLLSMGGYVQGCATDPLFTSSEAVMFAFNATGSGLPLNSVFNSSTSPFIPTAGDITNDEFIEMIFIYDPERGVGKKIPGPRNNSNYLNNVSASLPAGQVFTNQAYQHKPVYFRDSAKGWVGCNASVGSSDLPYTAGTDTVSSSVWPDGINLMPTLMIRNSTAAISKLTVDYLTIAQER
jgi:hypothetical protein